MVQIRGGRGGRGGGLIQLLAYGAQDLYYLDKININSNSFIKSYSYDLTKNICNDYNDYGDDYEFNNIRVFLDYTNINNDNILIIKNL